MNWNTYGQAYAACGLLWIIAPPAGMVMTALVTANLMDEFMSQPLDPASRGGNKNG